MMENSEHNEFDDVNLPHPPNDKAAGLEEDDDEEAVHDQLPSVEEAKANVDLEMENDPKKTKSRCRFCFYTCCCLCSAFIIVLVLAIAIPQLNSSGSSSNHSTHNQERAATLAPGAFEPRFDYVRDFLTGFSDSKDLDKEGSPQRKAAQWIADQDVLHLPIDDNTFIERYALAVLYYSTNGPNWKLHLGFLTERQTCDWFHVGFGSDDKPRYVGAHCSGGDKIQELFFPEKWLKGSFPPELRLLEDLRYISTYRNPGLAGEFPPVMRQLTNLEYLGMHFCDLEGTLPTWLGEMTSLTSLVLSNNDLGGSIPSGIAQLTKLNQLFLDDNGLKGDIKTLAPLVKLEALLLEDNQFHGSLHESMMKNWKHIEIMDLSSNNLTSTIPASLFELKNLSVVDLHTNQLTGSLPNVTNVNKALSFLALYENSIEGAIPSSFARLDKLSHLDFSSNLLTGDLPQELGSLLRMKYLFLSMNAFNEGHIPSFLKSMTKLEDLSLKATGRTGVIPHWLEEMTSLVLLDLDTNDLVGTIPRVIGESLVNLKFLLLNRNQLEGSIPASFEKLTNLDFLLLERNNMNGTAKHICDREDRPQVFMADCAELQCPCCSACCVDDETKEHCDDQVWLGGVDPIWETKYERTFYKFEKVKLREGGK